MSDKKASGESKKIPPNGIYSTYSDSEANDLVASDEWYIKVVTERGQIKLMRKR